MTRKFSIALIAVLTAAGASADDTKDYTIVDVPAVIPGKTIYGIACTNGTTECNYVWDASLCKQGTPRNANPFGADAGSAPSYTTVNGKRVRMFICI